MINGMHRYIDSVSGRKSIDRGCAQSVRGWRSRVRKLHFLEVVSAAVDDVVRQRRSGEYARRPTASAGKTKARPHRTRSVAAGEYRAIVSDLAITHGTRFVFSVYFAVSNRQLPHEAFRNFVQPYRRDRPPPV